MAAYPALDVGGVDDEGLVLAAADDYSPVAAQDHGGTLTLYFSDARGRDSAHAALSRAFPHAAITSRAVDDEDWARRSQENLGPITVGRVTVAPPWAADAVQGTANGVGVVILPSMGFGTGHHATTRLCLAALQTLTLDGQFVLDVGTGSGVLALAARRLGAPRASGIDHDPDAIHSARQNLALNPAAADVTFHVAALPAFQQDRTDLADVVVANLTGAALIRHANALVNLVRPAGAIVVSGLLASERAAVVAAFGMTPAWEAEESGWTAILFRLNRTAPATV